MNNAVKFTNHGSIILEINQVLRALDSTRVKISIIDTGTGIDPNVIQSIFPSHQHDDAEHSLDFNGPGLGLSVVKKVVRYLNGSIEVNSRPNSGTSFEITLDLENCSQSEKIEREVVDSIAEGRLNILIAEDDSTNQLILEEFFSDLAVKYTIVENGQEAVDQVRENNYDLILMDVQMPVMDGFTATKHIREAGNNIPIIAVSAHIQKEHLTRAQEVGCNDFIIKPIDFEKLKEMINSLV